MTPFRSLLLLAFLSFTVHAIGYVERCARGKLLKDGSVLLQENEEITVTFEAVKGKLVHPKGIEPGPILTDGMVAFRLEPPGAGNGAQGPCELTISGFGIGGARRKVSVTVTYLIADSAKPKTIQNVVERHSFDGPVKDVKVCAYRLIKD